MSWKDGALSVVRRLGPTAKFAAKLALGVLLPGSPAVIDLVEDALDCVQQTAKEEYEIRKDAQLHATPEDLRRLDELFGLLVGDLSSLVAQVAALQGMPDAARQILNTALATDDRVRLAAARLEQLARRFDRLEEQNRQILQQQGYAADLLEEMLPLMRRMAGVADWAAEMHAAGLNAKDFRAGLEAAQRLEARFASLKLEEVVAELRQVMAQRPASATARVAAAAVGVVTQDLPAAEARLALACQLRPQDGELAALRDRVTRATRGGCPLSSAGGPRVGDEMDGWRLEALLGQGGWGQVFRARRGGQVAALKVMRPELSREPDFVARFRREIMALCALRGAKYVVDVIDFGKDDKRGCWYFVMELVDGTSLETYLQRHGALSAGQARWLFAAVGEGLAVAHAKGIVHRDVKPANILLRADRTPVLVDFGVATRADGAATKLAGYTAAYASPEQLRGRPVDARSDVYSLAAAMWYALTYDSPDLRGPDQFDWERCPWDLREVLAQALQQRAEKRHEHAGAFRAHLLAKPSALVSQAQQAAPSSSVGTRAVRVASSPESGLPREFTNSIGMRFVLVEPGTFLMGSPPDEQGRDDDETQHEVTITKPFYLGVHQVTQGQGKKVMGNNPSEFSRNGECQDSVRDVSDADLDLFPVEGVSWEGAQEFLQALNELDEEARSGREYRLPTEAEWEYACRGGHLIKNLRERHTLPFHLDRPTSSLSSTQANFDGKRPDGGAPKGPYLERPCKVGSYQANVLGLYDMHGNVAEWCQDWYDANAYHQKNRKDPQGPDDGQYRVNRGGSYFYNALCCRAASRAQEDPKLQDPSYGFRVVCVPRAVPPAVEVTEETSVPAPVAPTSLAPLLLSPKASEKPTVPASVAFPTPAPTIRLREFTNVVGMRFVLVEPGRFLMGSPPDEAGRTGEEIQHEVTITRPFYLGVHLVTQGQWSAVMGNNPSFFRRGHGKGKEKVKEVSDADLDLFPVEFVSWVTVQAFLLKLAALEGEARNHREYRLPSEAEWEYACRGGHLIKRLGEKHTLPFHFDRQCSSLSGAQANFAREFPYGDGVSGLSLSRTCKVGSYQPNALGLHDMHGNVREWCADWYGHYPSGPATNPIGPPDGSDRVTRGGCYGSVGLHCRAACRSRGAPGSRSNTVGFRGVAILRE
jgi:formylglycine-generating enzyme required for sulfatase activity/predicted Ser/Thr protein kinase